jgi:high frequency lysogenization protein
MNSPRGQNELDGEVIGLAGVVQAVSLVRDVAHAGRADTTLTDTTLRSVLRLDASSPAEVYGGVRGIIPGLELLVAMLDGERRDAELTRMSATVLHLEPRLRCRPQLLEKIRDGVRRAAVAEETMGSDGDVLPARLGDLYSETISTLKPRVIVQGNCEYLRQPAMVARIRALLLAAVRGAVLWKQCGGSRWRLLTRRRKLAEHARQLLVLARRQG